MRLFIFNVSRKKSPDSDRVHVNYSQTLLAKRYLICIADIRGIFQDSYGTLCIKHERRFVIKSDVFKLEIKIRSGGYRRCPRQER